MIRSVNLPLCRDVLAAYGTSADLRRTLDELGIDGVEGIYDGFSLDPDFDPSLLTGYHLTFYPDWLDFYLEDKAALKTKFGSLEAAYAFYGGEHGPQRFLELYREDVRRGIALGARYMVFHVSDVSIEEGYTYSWLHSDEQVIDASINLINGFLAGVEPTFDFLVENQWWPGFTFTDPGKTKGLLDGIKYPRKGILLDTGHLMNANRAIRSQKDGVAFIREMVKLHGDISRYIYGIHLHQSVSGRYVNSHIGPPPADLPEEYNARFGVNYGHIEQIDRHRPWTDPAIAQVVQEIGPKYLTHEITARGMTQKLARTRRQLTTLRKGGLLWQTSSK